MFAKSQLKDAKSELKAAERHIKPGTYTVDSNGKVTMTYVDGNGHDVANEKAVIEGIAKKTTCRILQRQEDLQGRRRFVGYESEG